MRKKLLNIKSYEYEYPSEKLARENVEKLPGLEKLITKFNEVGYERISGLQRLGNCLKINKNNFPEIMNIYLEACSILDVKDIPDLYFENDLNINASAFGITKTFITITKGAIDFLSNDELLFLLGHELGHIKGRHTLYRLIAFELLPLVSIGIDQFTLGLGAIGTQALYVPLFYYVRMTELTCDRAGLLCCQNKSPALGVFMKFAGLPYKSNPEIFEKDFVNQANEFEDQNYDSLDKFWKKIGSHYDLNNLMYKTPVPRSHPYPLLRAKRLMEWINKGEYDLILNKDRKSQLLCAKCGANYKSEDIFCGNCGVKL